MTFESGPWRLVRQLRAWAADTPWCRWLELGGSLGRGSGDEMSDVDAGAGVPADALDDVLAAVTGFAPVAATFTQKLGGLDHLMVQYRDGRQLSLVLDPRPDRGGLPPGSIVLFDRTGALAAPAKPSALTASPQDLREWAFLAWWNLADVAKHAKRGSAWRAIEALHEARTMAWRLHAAALDLDYPVFAAVTVVNAKRQAPDGLDRTLPARPQDALPAAVALAEVLDRLTDREDPDIAGIRAHALNSFGSTATTPADPPTPSR
jgi:hypothetical protein